MINRLKTRLSSEQGFTLIELLVVIIILGILLAIAVPSYLSFKDRANKTASQANVRSMIPTVESFNADNVGALGDADNTASTSGYAGMTWTLLQSKYDQALPATDHIFSDATSGHTDISGVTAPTPDTATLSTANYCIYDQVGNWFAWKLGPQGTINTATDAALVCKP